LPQEAWMNPEANSEFARSFGTHPGPGAFEKYLYIGLALGATADDFTVYEAERLPEGVLCACKPCDGGYSAEVAVPAAWFDAQQGKPWEKFRFNVTLIDYDDSYAAPYTALWWRPEWNHAENYPDSGTFRRG